MTHSNAAWSVRLAAAFFLLFAIWLAYVSATPIPRPTFFSDPVHAVLILTAASAAIAGGALGTVALMKEDGRSIAVFASVLLGAFVLYWTIAELIGH